MTRKALVYRFMAKSSLMAQNIIGEKPALALDSEVKGDYVSYGFLLLLLKNLSEIVFKAVENSDIFCILTDAKGRIIYSNRGALELTGYPKDSLIGSSTYSIFLGGSDIERFLKGGQTFKGFIQGRKISGESFYLYTEIYPLREDGKIGGFLYLGERISGKASSPEFSSVQDFDSITGLPHERAFSTVIDTYIERHRAPLSLLIVDILGFGDISLAYGKDSAQSILREVAERLKKVLPPQSFMGKTVADEFLIALFGASKEEVGLFISNVLDEFSEPCVVEKRRILITLNIGVSSFPEDGRTYEELFSTASIALDRAKSQGENMFSIFGKDIEEKVREYVFQKEKLAEVLKEKGFLIFAQPYYSTKNREISGLEILLRIKEKEDVESVATIIDFLEHSGLISKVEDYLFEEIKKIGPKIDFPISINISARSFKTEGIIRKLKDLNDALSYPLLCEISERLFLEKEALEIIKKLKSIGVQIVIDDFGTGYSSLSYLESLPIDMVKVDISFVRRMLDEPKALAIVQTIIDLGKRLGMKVVAEGVENEEQFRILRLLLCDYVQGYYLSRPAPIESFIKSS